MLRPAEGTRPAAPIRRGRPRIYTVKPTRVEILLPPDVLARIDAMPTGNRTAWIREAIEQRLARERQS